MIDYHETQREISKLVGIPHRLLFPDAESNTKQLVEDLKIQYPNEKIEKELSKLEEKKN